jgi:hypothetical protein
VIRWPAVAFIDRFRKVSSAPTNPHAPARARAFDVAELYQGAVAAREDGAGAELPLDENPIGRSAARASAGAADGAR